MARENVEALLRELHAARLAGELERLCALFDPQGQLRIVGTSDGKPISVEARGIEQIRSWLGMLVRTFRLSDYECLALLVDGERGSVHWRADIRSRITGQRVATELADLVETRAGRILRQTEFFVPGAVRQSN
ncbi:MAG TPA: nuclear transport factor 2 family protein [Steroidobacteraceae bacterium]|nr:nuclear transport factor 2 family protein [Steroidobacteraceae bacterium]